MNREDPKSTDYKRIGESIEPEFVNQANIYSESESISGIVELSPEHLKDIADSKQDIEKGFLTDLSLLKKEVKLWLKGR
jgi:hypothetical protein